MKKLILAASLLAATFAANAQDMSTTTTTTTMTPAAGEPIRSKRGYAILPEAGDWSLRVDAAPLLNYFGNVINFNGNNTIVDQDVFSGTTVTGRYFTDANTAYRVSVGINLESNTSKRLVNDLSTGAAPSAQVEDKRTLSSTDVTLGLGIEKRKGISRVQGIYGAQAMLGLNGSSSKYTYGNAVNAGNPVNDNQFDPTMDGITKTKSGMGFMLGVQGFVGVEYFFAPKISIGGEFAWGPQFGFGGKGKTETESFDGTSVKTTEIESSSSDGQNYFRFRLNPSGILNLNFYF